MYKIIYFTGWKATLFRTCFVLLATDYSCPFICKAVCSILEEPNDIHNGEKVGEKYIKHLFMESWYLFF